jgi:predicted MFS family arabinose efflux permease
MNKEPSPEPSTEAALPDEREPPGAARVLNTAALAIFSSSLFLRAVDPIIPQIAGDLDLDTGTVALLSSAFALPYALVQPVLGVLADTLGKARLMSVAIGISALAGAIGATAPNFSVLLGSRILAGAVAGGIFPTALALAGDLVPVARRQVAIGRILAAAMIGNLLGSPFAGLVGDMIGWRGVFALVTLIAAVAFVAVLIGFRVMVDQRRRFDLAAVGAGFQAILRNPLTKICFSADLLEGIGVFGLFPYVAALLVARGEDRAIIAGLVIAGFGIGGIIYSFAVSRLLGRFGEQRMMLGGGMVIAAALLVIATGLPWPVEFLAFLTLGLGFYSLHGVIQVYATELAPHARGLAMSLHSAFFFLGQGLGPIVFRYGLATIGLAKTNALTGLTLVLVGIMCAHFLRRKH